MKIDTDDAMLPVVHAAELDQAEPERRWLVEQLWARAGVGIIGGHPKPWWPPDYVEWARQPVDYSALMA